jgi:hypothetical protein
LIDLAFRIQLSGITAGERGGVEFSTSSSPSKKVSEALLGAHDGLSLPTKK